jgi:hypothetical protein
MLQQLYLTTIGRTGRSHRGMASVIVGPQTRTILTRRAPCGELYANVSERVQGGSMTAAQAWRKYSSNCHSPLLPVCLVTTRSRLGTNAIN